MAIKQRALKKLHTTKHRILRMMGAGSRVVLSSSCHDLAELRELYREGLPQQYYAAYGEIFDGLILAVRTMIEDGEENFQEDVFALCQELLEHLEKETAKETRFKKEIFFLPYKASMFDSLESVWRAACADKERCIAYVMPIPYADRNPDQTAAEWHCERDQFPKDVPTLDWQQVNLKAWHPDVIIYHNPYDNCNAVTSVDEQYYSRNLRHCADKLVYIPYFVTGGRTISDHFCQIPGVFNADYVVCESEAIKRVYERNYRTVFSVPEGKFLPLGSPKYDKVVAAKKEDYSIPEAWKTIIGNRPVILYCTSLTAHIAHPEAITGKLGSVLAFFRQRKDVAFWWRPHPLMEATLNAMIPTVKRDYHRLRDEFLQAGWGIYDDTHELERAIAWSDAYYGDGSSLVFLYEKTGKPILKQFLNDINLKSEPRLDMEYICVDGSDVYFVSSGDSESFMGLFQLNIENDQLKFLGEIPAAYEDRLEFGALGRIGGKIVIAPYFSGDFFVEYDEQKQRMQRVSCRYHMSPHRSDGYAAFANVVRWQESLFLIGSDCNVIVEYMSAKDEYIYHERWLDMSELSDVNAPVSIARNGVVQKGRFVFACLVETNWIIQLDLESLTVEYVRMPFSYSASRLSPVGDDFFVLSTETEDLVYWQTGDGTFAKIPSEYYRQDLRVDGYTYAVSLADGIYFLPYRMQAFGKLDFRQGCVRQRDCLDSTTKISKSMFGKNIFPCACADLSSQRVFAFFTPGQDLLEFNMETGNIRHHKVSFPQLREVVQSGSRCAGKNGSLYFEENQTFDLETFVNQMSEMKNRSEDESSCGQKIMDEVLGNLGG